MFQVKTSVFSLTGHIKSIDNLTKTIKDLAKRKKEHDDFKKTNKDLTQHFDLNSLKYNEAKITIEDTTKTNFNVGSLIQIVDDNDELLLH